MSDDNVKPLIDGALASPALLLREIDKEFPDARDIVVVITDKEGGSHIRITDQSLSNLCFSRTVLEDFVLTVMRRLAHER